MQRCGDAAIRFYYGKKCGFAWASGAKRFCNRRDRHRRQRHVQADNEDVARLGPVAFAGVQHAGRNTEDYFPDEVQAMAQRIASELGKSLWSIQDEKTVNKQTLGRYQIGGDDDVIK